MDIRPQKKYQLDHFDDDFSTDSIFLTTLEDQQDTCSEDQILELETGCNEESNETVNCMNEQDIQPTFDRDVHWMKSLTENENLTNIRFKFKKDIMQISKEYGWNFPENYFRGKRGIFVLRSGINKLDIHNILPDEITLKLTKKEARQEDTLKGCIVPSGLKFCAVYNNKIYIVETMESIGRLWYSCSYLVKQNGKWTESYQKPWKSLLECPSMVIEQLQLDPGTMVKSILLIFSTHVQFKLRTYFRNSNLFLTEEAKKAFTNMDTVESCPCPNCNE